jgi:hypothetical protein
MAVFGIQMSHVMTLPVKRTVKVAIVGRAKYWIAMDIVFLSLGLGMAIVITASTNGMPTLSI